MSVIHISKRENPYVQIDKRVLEDPRLTWRSKGILAYLLSKPSGWKVNVKDIWGKGGEGRNAVQDCLVELQKIGYAKLVSLQGDHGRLAGSMWQVTEEPIGGFQVNAEKPKTGSPKNRKSGSRLHSNNEDSLLENQSDIEGSEGEENTPTPEPKNLKEEKPRSVEVAPGAEEWPTDCEFCDGNGMKDVGSGPVNCLECGGSGVSCIEAEIPPSKKVAPKKVSPAGNYEPSEFDIYGPQPLEIYEGETPDEFEARIKEQAADDKTPPLPKVAAKGVHKCDKACGPSDFYEGGYCDKNGCFEATAIASPTDLPGVPLVEPPKIQPLPRVATTIEAEQMIATWIAGEGIETVKYRFNIAKQRFDPDNAAAIAAHYCSVYTKNAANKERLLKDPVTHFSDGLFSYLKNEESFGRMNAPKEGGQTRQNGQPHSALPRSLQNQVGK